MNLFRIEFLCRHEITKIVMICNHADEVFITLQIMSSIFKFQNYRIQFFVMRISSFFCFLEFVIHERNEMLLIIVVFLIKHVFDAAIKRIDFHLQRNTLIVML